MLEAVTAEKIYVAFATILREAKIVTCNHGARLSFFGDNPVPPGSDCNISESPLSPEQVFLVLKDLQTRVQKVVVAYAELYGLGK